MQNVSFLSVRHLLAVGFCAVAFLTACSEQEDPIPEIPAEEPGYQLAFASGSGSISGTYMQGVPQLDSGTISFEKAGALLSTGRTSRIFPSEDGKYVYSLTYTVGTVDKWQYKGGSQYTKLSTIDASVPLGHASLRFYKLNEEVGSLHYISSKAQYDGTTYLGHEMIVSIGILHFESMQLHPNYRSDIKLELPADLTAQGYNITRIDAPVLANGKLYYGAAAAKFDPVTGLNGEIDKAFTVVVDYPTLSNPTVLQTDLAVGSTNGYRTPTQQVNEQGEIYQLINAHDQTSIVKLVDGHYHATYKYSLDELLGQPTSSNGFFYAGNGIAYIPYEKRHLEQIQIGVNPQGEPSYSSAWGIARMDLVNHTVVDLNVPDGLWLTQWQASVFRDGKFYIALSPVGAPGHIYSFDVHSMSPEGTKGAATVSGADQYFIGIY